MIAAEERRAHIEDKLKNALATVHVEVIDESHLHAGHAGARSGGGHFRALIVSQRFQGLNRVQAQRLVFEVLAEEMKSDIHALAMKTLTPDQFEASSD
jgi:BolA protein